MEWRNIENGSEIPSEGYCDQPFIVKTDDDAWLCVVTTGGGHEGQSGQHVVTTRSIDHGSTWSTPIDVEPIDGPEASYAVPYKVPSGRIYLFYNHNTDNIRRIIADNPPYEDGYCTRVDSLGYFVFKYSDDHGRTWSQDRYPIPVRLMEIDRKNPYQGEIRFFWNVGKPFAFDGSLYVSLHKVGGIGQGFFTSSEGVLLRSENLLEERDPQKITWETLPDGEIGLRTPAGGGPVSEEHSYSVMSDGSIYVVYRSIDGYPVEAYSRDGGRTWTPPAYKQYANGRLMKHPRAANFAWRCGNGKYLYWFHNHGGKGYDDRNPVWISMGEEVDLPSGRIIRWSEPEIILYQDDPYVRMSYPDLVESDGKYFLTETQKEIARVHQIAPKFLDMLWQQFEIAGVVKEGLMLSLPIGNAAMPAEVPMPKLPVFLERDNYRPDYGAKDERNGFSIDLWVQFRSLEAGQMLLDTRLESGIGLCLQMGDLGVVEMILNDGRTENRWACDPGILDINRLHHIGIVVDGGPKIITFIIDGVLCDGGESRQFGWGRFSPHLQGVNGTDILKIASGNDIKIVNLRFYDRALMTTEMISNYRAS